MRSSITTNEFLDLRGTPCPVNLVRCCLAIENLSFQDCLEVIIDRGEPEEMVISGLIGMNRDNSLKKFLKDPSAIKHHPALGEATISGLMVIADNKTGLANKVEPIVLGGSLENRI